MNILYEAFVVFVLWIVKILLIPFEITWYTLQLLWEALIFPFKLRGSEEGKTNDAPSE